MVIAALLCFVALLVAWILAPDETPAAAQPDRSFEAELAPAA